MQPHRKSIAIFSLDHTTSHENLFAHSLPISAFAKPGGMQASLLWHLHMFRIILKLSTTAQATQYAIYTVQLASRSVVRAARELDQVDTSVVEIAVFKMRMNGSVRTL